MHTTSQEYLIKLLIGNSDFSFAMETIVFRLNLSLNSLFFILLLLCVNLGNRFKGLFNVAKISKLSRNGSLGQGGGAGSPSHDTARQSSGEFSQM